MNCKLVAGLVVLMAAMWPSAASAEVNVMGSSTSRVTDLTANPNAVNDVHSFNNTTPATILAPTTTSSTVAMAFGSTSGTVTASEGLFQGFSTATYANTGFNEDAQTGVRATANDLATITSATLPMMELPEHQLRWALFDPAEIQAHYSGKTVIVGHTEQENSEICDLGFAVCIDTACWRHGWLTAYDARSKTVWQASRWGVLREPDEPTHRGKIPHLLQAVSLV